MRAILPGLLALLLLVPSASQAAQKRVLFDNAHGEIAGNADWQIDTDQPFPLPPQQNITQATARTYWLGGISSWGVDLVKRGYYVLSNPAGHPLSYGNNADTMDLSHFDVLIVPEPNDRFSSAESLAIFNFVRDGGGLVAVSDHDISDRDSGVDKWDSPRIWDHLDAQHFFGVHFDTTGDANNNFSQETNNVESALNDTLIHGPNGVADSLSFHNGTSMQLYPAVNSSVRGDIWMTGAAHGTTQVMAAHSTYGNGRIFFLGDSSPIDDGSATAGNSSIFDGWGEAAGRDSLLLQNATYWVTRRDLAVDGTPPVVTVTAPNGGESFGLGSSTSITWTATDNVGVANVDVDYSLNAGGTWINLAAGIANSGSLPWTVPVTPSTQARVRVTAHDAAGNSGQDASDANFTLSDQTPPSVAVLSPNGSETWSLGSVHNITWTATDNVAVSSVDVDYSLNGGTIWTNFAAAIANSGTLPWTVPATPTTQARVRVTAHDAAGNSGQDASDANFTLADQTPPTVTVLSPNGGETWAEGSVHNITWTAADNVSVTSVNVDYSPDGGTNWTSLAAGISNSGTFPWTTPLAPTTQGRVRITARDAANNSAPDASDSNFTLSDQSPPSVTVLSPNGGESWLTGSGHSITWTASDNIGVDSVALELSLNGPAGPWIRITGGLPNSGSYSWTVPATPSDSAVVRISAYDAMLLTGVDVSDSLFQITAPVVGITPQIPSSFFVARPAPNPSRSGVRVRFGLPAAGRTRFQVLDVAGRRILERTEDLPAGIHDFNWDGRSAVGSAAPAGRYFVRISAPSGQRSVALLRLP